MYVVKRDARSDNEIRIRLSEKPVFQMLTENHSDGADVVSSGRVFQTWGPATEKTLLPTVESLTGGTTRLLHCVPKKACDAIYLSIIRILIARL